MYTISEKFIILIKDNETLVYDRTNYKQYTVSKEISNILSVFKVGRNIDNFNNEERKIIDQLV